MGLTLDEALSEAVLGARITSDSIQQGAYVEYQFNGWRINFPAGSSCGWRPFDIHKAAEWRVVPIEPPPPKPSKWGKFAPVANSVETSFVEPDEDDVKPVIGQRFARQAYGRALRSTGPTPLVIDAGATVWSLDRKSAPTGDPAGPYDVGKWGKPTPPVKDKWGRLT